MIIINVITVLTIITTNEVMMITIVIIKIMAKVMMMKMRIRVRKPVHYNRWIKNGTLNIEQLMDAQGN